MNRVFFAALLFGSTLRLLAMEVEDPIQSLVAELEASEFFFNFGDDARAQAERYLEQLSYFEDLCCLIRNSSKSHMLGISIIKPGKKERPMVVDITAPKNAVLIKEHASKSILRDSTINSTQEKGRSHIKHGAVIIVQDETSNHLQLILKGHKGDVVFECFEDLLRCLAESYWLLTNNS